MADSGNNSSPPPSPPPIPPTSPKGKRVDPNANGGGRNKRFKGDSGAGPSIPQEQRLAIVPRIEEVELNYECFVCQMKFESDKSLFGHMRMHPERPWRGMYPPPTFTRTDFADVGDLLNSEVEGNDGDIDDVNDNGNGGGGGNRVFILPDLNKTPSPSSST